ncbi:peptidyl-prolyl cis-trans isomerase D [Poseidonocella pacifica]|uniref:Peptidyl-prolyl cis-trans isomerase D n=1 Tax=Poseidonocella pacifica TaxID=871651 RepID=A0A1I0VE02_9RHOB|nr:peptidylprolyl isomerase [Poseidonocella pacifica]SFA74595.1 peptidyl-prolyl cis-trans isomerase D [Poseidonocella pacifica]
MAAKKKISNLLVFGLLALLIVGLAGFGATGLSGTSRTVGDVGGEGIAIERYAREVQQVINEAETQAQRSIPFAEAQSIGLDRVAISRLVGAVALEVETSHLGISAGDEFLREQILAIPNLRKSDGTFDRDAYAFALQSNGLTEAEFEDQLRRDAARGLLERAINTGIDMPDAYETLMFTYLGERRSFTYAPIEANTLNAPLSEPSDEDLRAFHEENAARYMIPETKRITYAWLLPDMIVGDVTVDEDALRESYEERIDEFVQPERRLVERLVFPDLEAAEEVRGQIDAAEIPFEAAVIARGLELADIDLGDVTRESLGAAGDPVFAAANGNVVGPIDTDFGPALFRVNGVIDATETSFEEAVPFLREDLAMERARRTIEAQASDIDDRLAGGATLEEIADETDMEIGTIDWRAGIAEDIAAYDSFNDAARTASEEDYPEVTELTDGGIFAVRLDEVVAARSAPFEDVAEEVRADWDAQQTAERLNARAEEILPQLREGASFEEAGLAPTSETNLTRRDFLADMPGALLDTVFAMETGDIETVSGENAVYVLRLDEITEPDPEADDLREIATRISDQAAQSLAADIGTAYANALRSRLGVRIDQQVLNAVNVNFQ